MRIGLFGGSFDPPHNGHLALAQAAIEQLHLDELILLPANQNPLKKGRPLASGKDRLTMLQTLTTLDERILVSDLELTRGGQSFMVDTLSELQMVRPGDYWLIMGSDSVRTLTEWKQPERLLRMCRLAVAIRPPVTGQNEEEPLPDYAQLLEPEEVDHLKPDLVEPTKHEVLSKLPDYARAKVDWIEFTPMEVASSQIRNDLARGKSVNPFVPVAVHSLIQQRKLYK